MVITTAGAWTAEAWLRQRGTFPTTAKVLRRDLGTSMQTGAAQLSRLARSGLAVRLCLGRYVHRDTFPEHRMAILILTDDHGVERHRVSFPTRVRAEIALRIVERDIRDGREAVRIVGHDDHDPLYTVTRVARARIQPAAELDVAVEQDEPAFDARARAAGDDR